jgi:hypothetical protein
MNQFLEAFREREHITGKQLLCFGLVWLVLIGTACQKPSPRNSELRFKGKDYVVCGLKGAGYTREHRSPVYEVIVMAKEDTKKWTNG